MHADTSEHWGGRIVVDVQVSVITRQLIARNRI